MAEPANIKPVELTYKTSGVDIEAGYEAVKRIKEQARRTFGQGVIGDIGSFGGLFALSGEFTEPVLVAGTDGVGTKLKIAFMMGKHDTVGIDAVAYCVNDIICHGAKPLFFLDYLAVGKMDPALVAEVVKGVATGCCEAGAALIGGETAEMPGFYPEGEYDIAGFAVGVIEKSKIIDGSKVKPGDILIGLASSGLHSSGFSLVRKVFFEIARRRVDEFIPELCKPLGEELLTPTKVYARGICRIVSKYDIHAIANITGGGFYENIPRSLAPGTRAIVRKGSWEVPAIFGLLQREGRISNEEMARTYNLGIGMVVVADSKDSSGVVAELEAAGEKAFVIGEVAPGQQGLDIVG